MYSNFYTFNNIYIDTLHNKKKINPEEYEEHART